MTQHRATRYAVDQIRINRHEIGQHRTHAEFAHRVQVRFHGRRAFLRVATRHGRREELRSLGQEILGEEGRGLQYLMSHLPRERLGVTAQAIATTRAIFDQTVQYCQQRNAFGQPLTALQHIRFQLAEMATELDITEAYVDKSVHAFNAGELSAVDAAKGKWYVSELQRRLIDSCLQLHGGYGYMVEYPVARAYLDTRAQTIYGGTTEIMKELIGREIAGSNQTSHRNEC